MKYSNHQTKYIEKYD